MHNMRVPPAMWAPQGGIMAYVASPGSLCFWDWHGHSPGEFEHMPSRSRTDEIFFQMTGEFLAMAFSPIGDRVRKKPCSCYVSGRLRNQLQSE